MGAMNKDFIVYVSDQWSSAKVDLYLYQIHKEVQYNLSSVPPKTKTVLFERRNWKYHDFKGKGPIK